MFYVTDGASYSALCCNSQNLTGIPYRCMGANDNTIIHRKSLHFMSEFFRNNSPSSPCTVPLRIMVRAIDSPVGEDRTGTQHTPTQPLPFMKYHLVPSTRTPAVTSPNLAQPLSQYYCISHAAFYTSFSLPRCGRPFCKRFVNLIIERGRKWTLEMRWR